MREILRRDEYPIPVPEKMRKVLADLKGEPLVIPAAHAAGDIRIPNLLRETTFEKLEQTRAALFRLAQQPDWVRRVEAFFEEGDGTERNHVALLLSLKPEALPEDVQERCWTVLREQVAWYDRSAASYPKERKGWLLKEAAVMAVGLRPPARTLQARLHRPAGSRRGVPKSARSGCFEPRGLEESGLDGRPINGDTLRTSIVSSE